MGQAATRWEELVEVLQGGDIDRLLDMYTDTAIYLEPYNPPHHGNLLIQAYLKDWLGSKEGTAITVKRVVENQEGTLLAAEWTVSYTAGGRRWNNLPRTTWIEVGDDGLIVSQRDY